MILKLKKEKSNLFQHCFPPRCAREMVPYSCSFWLHNCCFPGCLGVTKENRTFAFLPYYISHSFCFNWNPEQASVSHNQIIKSTQLPFFSASG